MFAAKELTENEKEIQKLQDRQGKLIFKYERGKIEEKIYHTISNDIDDGIAKIEFITDLEKQVKKLKHEIWEMRENGVKPKELEPVKEVTASDVYPEKKKSNTMSDRYVGD